MQTFAFIVIIGSIAAVGGTIVYRRWRAYQADLVDREAAQAMTLETIKREALAASAPRTSAPVRAATRVEREAAPSRHQNAMIALDADSLRQLNPAAFVRVCMAYFEATGVRVQRQPRETQINALLFSGAAVSPLMALRWSRSAEHPASSRELNLFADAVAKLGMSHATFIAQNGATLNATKVSMERRITLIGPDQLSAKIAAIPSEQQSAIARAALSTERTAEREST